MLSKVRLALLGCGDVAQRDYLPEFHRVADRAELVAVCGRTERRARSVAESYGVRAWYTDYARMLAETDVEAVVNLTPIQLHAETTIAALKAGKHVYTEKPVATTVADARRIRDEARRRGLRLVCAPCVMLFPQVRYVRSLLEAGVIGEVYSARGSGHGGVPPWSGFTSDPSPYFSKGGGPAMDMAVYPLHALTGLLASAKRVTAMTARAQRSFIVEDGPAKGKQVPIEVDDNWHILVDFGGSRLASVDANNCAQGSRAPQLEIFGLRGTAAVNLLDVSAPVEVLRAGAEWERVELPRTGRAAGPDHLLGVEHLLDCIQYEHESMLSVEHALHVVEIIEKATLSAAEGRAFEIESTFPANPH
jgi:predicted dehydrogenase